MVTLILASQPGRYRAWKDLVLIANLVLCHIEKHLKPITYHNHSLVAALVTA